MRGDGRNRAGGRHADGDAQEHPAEHPRGAAAFPAVGAGAGQEFPQEHRVFDPRQGAFHGTALQFRAPHGLCLQQGRVQQGTRLAHSALAAGKTLRRGAVPQGAGSVRREPQVLRGRRRAARRGAAAVLLRHRHPDVSGLRPLGSDARHLDQLAQVPLAPVRVVGQDTDPARPEDRRRNGTGASPRTERRRS